MSPMNQLNVGAFQSFAMQKLYADLYPFIINDFKHKTDIEAIISAMLVQQHVLVKPVPPSLNAAGMAQKSALDAMSKVGQVVIDVLTTTGSQGE